MTDRRLRVLYAAPGLVLRPGCGPCEHFLSVTRALHRRPDVDLEVLIGAPTKRGVEPVAAGVPKDCKLHLLPQPQDAWAVIDSLALGSHPGRYLDHQKLLSSALEPFRDNPPDVVIERMWGFGGTLGRKLQKLGSTWIVEENGPPGFELRRRRITDVLRGIYLAASRLRASWLYRAASRVIVQTDALKQRMIEQFRVPEGHLEVIPNGIDRTLLERARASMSKAGARRELGLTPDATFLVYCGSLDRNHYVRKVVEAFMAVRRPRNVQLLILGMGFDQHAIEDLIAADSANTCKPSAVRLIEPQPPKLLEKYLLAADLALAPYDETSFPKGRFGFSSLKVREYLAFDLPVAATHGTTAELVREGENGFLIHRSEGWRKLFETLPPRDQLASMGRGGHQRIASYTYDEVAQRYLEISCQIVGHQAPTALPVRSNNRGAQPVG